MVRENSGVKDSELFKRKPVTETFLNLRNTAKNRKRALDNLAFNEGYDIEKEAAIAWSEGVDGVYIYNLWFNPSKNSDNSFFYTIGNKELMSQVYDPEYKTLFKGSHTLTRGFVKNTAEYVTDAFVNSMKEQQ